ncbi:hypothetical protein B0H16DRAFT_494706 [Mycena metata]|uniref:Uncharacterized protein n=1 Tax=Mycena metata TaxID=1033252 RepID=A0AAD7NJJ7_9AGAR|nr:hypothetical protein B0H16DRAFT_494706 [Mycena metata]
MTSRYQARGTTPQVHSSLEKGRGRVVLRPQGPHAYSDTANSPAERVLGSSRPPQARALDNAMSSPAAPTPSATKLPCTQARHVIPAGSTRLPLRAANHPQNPAGPLPSVPLPFLLPNTRNSIPIPRRGKTNDTAFTSCSPNTKTMMSSRAPKKTPQSPAHALTHVGLSLLPRSPKCDADRNAQNTRTRRLVY